MSVFHEGELAVQARAGVAAVAAKVGRNIMPSIPPDYDEFLRSQPFVVVAGLDRGGRVWASLLAGGEGFARAVGDREVVLDIGAAAGDPLAAALEPPGTRVGILAIEFDSRTRIRLNGLGELREDGLVIAVDEVFGNCPKYIQRRVPSVAVERANPTLLASGVELGSTERDLIRAADTFFIASVHGERGADASHRGGTPGFVEVAPDGRSLRFPDYSGNRMFQTLGNLASDPRTGLLFVNWESGAALQLSGRASIVWDRDEIAARPGAERLIDFQIERVLAHAGALPPAWHLIEVSRLNPPLT